MRFDIKLISYYCHRINQNQVIPNAKLRKNTSRLFLFFIFVLQKIREKWWTQGTRMPPSNIKWHRGTGRCPGTVIPERGRWWPPPRSHVGAHPNKCTVSVCPHFLASISRCRLLMQDRKLCFCRLRVKVTQSRRQI